MFGASYVHRARYFMVIPREMPQTASLAHFVEDRTEAGAWLRNLPCCAAALGQVRF